MHYLPLCIACLLVPSAAIADADQVSNDGAFVGQTVEGTLRVMPRDDGDTITVMGSGPVRIRIHGIDAPENDQKCRDGEGAEFSCGSWVTEQVRRTWDGERVSCDVLDIDEFKRAVGICQVNGDDIGRTIVRRGLATAYVKYSTAYVDAERAARLEEGGLFAGSMQDPARFRDRQREDRKDQTKGLVPPNPECPIKGNINSNGERIYHSPEQRDYAITGIKPGSEERWFCSAEEAEIANWRAAKR